MSKNNRVRGRRLNRASSKAERVAHARCSNQVQRIEGNDSAARGSCDLSERSVGAGSNRGGDDGRVVAGGSVEVLVEQLEHWLSCEVFTGCGANRLGDPTE